jgi:hypothetical protein
VYMLKLSLKNASSQFLSGRIIARLGYACKIQNAKSIVPEGTKFSAGLGAYC